MSLCCSVTSCSRSLIHSVSLCCAVMLLIKLDTSCRCFIKVCQDEGGSEPLNCWWTYIYSISRCNVNPLKDVRGRFVTDCFNEILSSCERAVNSECLRLNSSAVCAAKWNYSLWKQRTDKANGKTRAACQTEEHTPVHSTGEYSVSGGETKQFHPHSSSFVPSWKDVMMRRRTGNEDPVNSYCHHGYM